MHNRGDSRVKERADSHKPVSFRETATKRRGGVTTEIPPFLSRKKEPFEKKELSLRYSDTDQGIWRSESSVRRK